MEILFKRLKSGAQLPQRATPGSAGLDIRACIEEGALVIPPGERALVPTGLALQLPGSGHAAFLFARSGQAMRRGLALANGVGVIDSDYRGEICVAIVNLSAGAQEIQDGERIAQLVVMPVETPAAIFAKDALEETGRGSGGFGSTGTE